MRLARRARRHSRGHGRPHGSRRRRARRIVAVIRPDHQPGGIRGGPRAVRHVRQRKTPRRRSASSFRRGRTGCTSISGLSGFTVCAAPGSARRSGPTIASLFPTRSGSFSYRRSLHRREGRLRPSDLRDPPVKARPPPRLFRRIGQTATTFPLGVSGHAAPMAAAVSGLPMLVRKRWIASVLEAARTNPDGDALGCPGARRTEMSARPAAPRCLDRASPRIGGLNGRRPQAGKRSGKLRSASAADAPRNRRGPRIVAVFQRVGQHSGGTGSIGAPHERQLRPKFDREAPK